MNWGAFLLDLLKILGGVVAGAIIGFFLARKYMKKFMKKKTTINLKIIKSNSVKSSPP